MRTFEFIHSEEDVPLVLLFAAGSGFTIRRDQPTKQPYPDIVSAHDLSKQTDGVFILYRPEWVFGSFHHDQILEGYNRGKYFQKPTTNYVGLTLSFGGERVEGPICRLGDGFLSRNVDWYRPIDHTVQPAPPEVKAAFDSLRKHIDTRKRLRGGVHTYTVLEGAWKKLTSGCAVPPFDYIEWPQQGHD